jgi:hypothetical protein
MMSLLTELDLFCDRNLQRCQPYGLGKICVQSVARNSNADCPNRPSQNVYRKRVPVRRHQISVNAKHRAPRRRFGRSAACPKPQRVRTHGPPGKFPASTARRPLRVGTTRAPIVHSVRGCPSHNACTVQSASKKSHVVRSGEAAADEDTRAPRRRIGARKDLM